MYEKRRKSQKGFSKLELKSESRYHNNLTKNSEKKPEKHQRTNSMNVFQEPVSNSENNQNQTSSSLPHELQEQNQKEWKKSKLKRRIMGTQIRIEKYSTLTPVYHENYMGKCLY